MAKFKVFAGNSNPKLAQHIADRLGIELGKCEIKKFSDGESSVSINESVRGYDVYIIQSTCTPVNDNLMELLVMADAFRRASANRVIAVIPYFGYARQDRKAKSHDPISARLVADLIETSGIDHVITMDLHAAQIQGFFSIPVDNLHGSILAVSEFYHNYNLNDEWVVVSPDLGSVVRSRNFAGHLHLPLAIVDKRRPKANVCEVVNIIGDVKDKNVIIIDDMIDTAGTLCNSAQAIKDMGAKKIVAFATHGVLSGSARERIENSVLDKVILSETIPVERGPKIDVLDTSDIFSKAIKLMSEDKSLSELFI